MNRITIFLSHSSKDIEKVKKIRDILELLGFKPLIFYLKCLDDDCETLNELLKREIEARNLFLYCRSKASEKSKWVQEELNYIKSFDSKRLYEIDIDNFQKSMVGFLGKISDIIYKNQIVIYADSKDLEIATQLYSYLVSKDFVVSFADSRAPQFSLIGMPVCEYEKAKNGIQNQVEKMIQEISTMYLNEAILIPIITDNLYSQIPEDWAKMYKAVRLFHEFSANGGKVLPLFIDEKLNSNFKRYCVYVNDKFFDELYNLLLEIVR